MSIAEETPSETTEAEIKKLYPDEEWAKPEALPEELPPVANFDMALMPDSLRAWVLDISNRMQCAPDYIGVTVMVALGSLIGRKIAIRPQQKSDWTVVANQWSMLIGRPGHMKSPAMEAGLAPLKRLEAQANETYQAEFREYKAAESIRKLQAKSIESKAQKILSKNLKADVSGLYKDMPDNEPPARKRYSVNDTSVASLGEVHRQNPNGLMIFRDELVSLLKSLDREDKAEDRGFYLTGWNGDSSYTFDRIGRGLHLHIPAVCLSMLGSTQPGRISEYVRHAVKGGMGDDGLLQRFGLMVWPDDKRQWKHVDQWPDSKAKNKAFEVFDFLDKLDPVKAGAIQDTDSEGNPTGIHYLRFNDEAREEFVKWRTVFENRLRGDDLHQAIESHLSKYRKLVPGIALIHHLASGYTGAITIESLLTSLSWAEYLETHANRVYASVTLVNVVAAKAILKRIRSGDIQDGFKARDIYRKCWQKLDKAPTLEGLDMLTEYGWLRGEIQNTGGRPTEQYWIHQEVLP